VPPDLSGVLDELSSRWSLTVGPPLEHDGECSWVAPARTARGDDAVLKLGMPQYEAVHEAEALRLWGGAGAVRLLDSGTVGLLNALLLERCRPGTQLRSVPEPEQDLIVAGLLRRLWRPAPAPFRPLGDMCDAWAEEFDSRESGLDPGLIRAGIALFRALPASAPTTVLLCTDLHAGNILAAAREPWLVIDPKPFAGDPCYDVLQHMLNCDRLLTDPVGLARRMAELLELDEERVLLWAFARCVQESPSWPGMDVVASKLAP
jgi:streptomycin 6-kinase